MDRVAELCRLYASAGLVREPRRFRNYLETIFRDVRFDGARVLDVGSGAGAISAYAVTQGAESVVALEPERSGSAGDVRRVAARLFEEMGMAARVEQRSESFEDFDSDGTLFDVVVLHNTINHLDETACIALRRDPNARARYVALLERLAALVRPGGQLFVSDCSPRNIRPLLGQRSSFERSIGWRKHHPAGEWIRLLQQAGFDRPVLRWTPVSRLGRIGRILTGNQVASFFTASHFHLTMIRATPPSRT